VTVGLHRAAQQVGAENRQKIIERLLEFVVYHEVIRLLVVRHFMYGLGHALGYNFLAILAAVSKTLTQSLAGGWQDEDADRVLNL
jgi:hypothetical protein